MAFCRVMALRLEKPAVQTLVGLLEDVRRRTLSLIEDLDDDVIVLWIVYVIADTQAVAWVAFAVVAAVAGLGFTMLALWLQRHRHPAAQGPGANRPAEQHFPPTLVAFHGLIAAATLVIVVSLPRAYCSARGAFSGRRSKRRRGSRWAAPRLASCRASPDEPIATPDGRPPCWRRELAAPGRLRERDPAAFVARSRSLVVHWRPAAGRSPRPTSS